MLEADSYVTQWSRRYICSDNYDPPTFVLSNGALEGYLPTGCKRKDLQKLIRLVSQPKFWTLLPETRAELEQNIPKI